METNNQKYGILLTPDIRQHRQYFREMCKLIGIRVIYRSPKPGRKYTTYAEIDANYNPPLLVGCIFDEHPSQQTLRKMGWMSELDENSSFIHVDYDLPNLQQGSMFIVPSGLDDGNGRLFRVVKMATSMVYPASITCEIVPEYTNAFDEANYGLDVNALIASDDLNVFESEEVRPMTSYTRDENEIEEAFALSSG